MNLLHNNWEFTDRRRELRTNSTKAEQIFWFEVRDMKMGPKFKRQHSIGGYITDFYCAKYKLIIELDGEIHGLNEAKEYDEVRDKYFKDLDYKVLRFLNGEVENNIEKVLEKIKSNFNNEENLPK